MTPSSEALLLAMVADMQAMADDLAERVDVLTAEDRAIVEAEARVDATRGWSA